MKSILLIFLLGFLINFECISSSEIYNSIFWAPENPLFTKGCSLQLKVRQASTVKFVCPNPATILQTRRTNIQKGNMYENIRIVYNKTRYDTCNATNTTNPDRTTLQFECNDPLALMYFPVVFNPHSAESNTPKFKPGKTYYFLATSDGTESHNKDETGGHCSGDNGIFMKFEVYVCNDTSDNVTDPLCDNGVGELQCINEPTTPPSVPTEPTTITPTPVSTSDSVSSSSASVSSSSASVSSSSASVSSTSASNTNKTTSTTAVPGARQGQRGSDSTAEEMKKWKAAFIALLVLCLLICVIGLIFVCFRKKIRGNGKNSNRCFGVTTQTVNEAYCNKAADDGGKNVDEPYYAKVDEDKKGEPEIFYENKGFKEEDSPDGNNRTQTKENFNFPGQVPNGKAVHNGNHKEVPG